MESLLSLLNLTFSSSNCYSSLALVVGTNFCEGRMRFYGMKLGLRREKVEKTLMEVERGERELPKK